MGLSSFTSNPLLVKDAVGKTRPTVFDLPGNDHVYGKKVDRNPEECASQVLQHWNVKATSKHAIPALDYITMNRNTAKHGINSPRAIRDYRKQHPVRIKVGDHNLFGGDVARARDGNGGGEPLTSSEARKLKLLGTLPHDSDPNFVYGMPTRPSTPVSYLMTDKFQREWIAAESRRNADHLRLEKERRRGHHHHHRPNNSKTHAKDADSSAQQPRVLIVDKDPRTLFKMSKFLSKGPKIQCWRGDVAEKREHEFAAEAAARRRNGAKHVSGAGSHAHNADEELENGMQHLAVSEGADHTRGATKNVSFETHDLDGDVEPPKVLASNDEGPHHFSGNDLEKPKVRFIDPANARGSRSVRVAPSMEPSPVANKKLLAAPGAAPEGWNPQQAVSV
ncbi:hypothetical protein HDU81_006906 [Chytriomyces hyalinus]|nr:hypothetical protein HDU81_006906 [Chytriomyces hyalinus]